MRSADAVWLEAQEALKVTGSSLAYLVAGGCELYVFDCSPEVQSLLLELQEADPVPVGLSRLDQIFNLIVIHRGTAFCSIEPTHRQSSREIEAGVSFQRSTNRKTKSVSAA
jgi:hypothetical protein